MAETRPSSSDSPAECPDSGLDEPLPRGSHVSSPSKPGCAKRDFMMMPPEENLKYFDARAQTREGNLEFDSCIEDLVRCLALTRLVYGNGHLKLAQAHVRLAKAYFQFKGWGQQAQVHASLAREELSTCSSISSSGDAKHEVLLSIHLTNGGAALLASNLDEAESSFLEAEQVLKDLHQRGAITQEEEMRSALEISTSLCRVYMGQKRPEEALSRCERSLLLLQDCDKPEMTCSVYRDMADIEQDMGHLDRAIEHLSKAHAIAMSKSPEDLEGAQITHSLALLLCSAAEPHHKDSAGHYFEQSLSAYEKLVGQHDPAFLTAQDDFCRFLLLNGQQERCVEILRASLTLKRSTYGDLSAEVADTLQLIGSVAMTKGKMLQAHRTMTECLEIQSLLYGPQHKTTKETQRAVNMLARAPEVAERLHRQSKRKT